MKIRTDDEIVDAIRADREAHAKRFGYDLTAIVRDLKKVEKTCGLRLVRCPERRRLKASA